MTLANSSTGILAAAAWLAAATLCSCSSGSDTPDAGDGDADGDIDGDGDSDGDGDADADADEEPVVYYDPRQVHGSDELPPLRGFTIRRGIIHAHSIYSHDACDGEPFIDGVRNEQCFRDLRDGMCDTRQDFVFLTDHADLFAEHDFPDVLIFDDGDELIERGGAPVANRVVCADGHEVIVTAGSETFSMPIGLERHVGDTVEERYAALDDETADGVRALQAAGALVFLQHTEGWEVDTILSLPIDGIEIYNLHQNLEDNLGVVASMLIDLGTQPERAPDVELGLIAIFQESEADLYRWSRAVETRRMPAIIASDVHRNAFSGVMYDGDRLDSYRRIMHWFSNYLLVTDGDGDDLPLKEAIGHGRLYCAFDVLGYPTGFDFHAVSAGDTTYEMGDITPLGESVELQLTLPQILDLDPEAARPVMRGRILRAGTEGTWEEVASETADISYLADPGVYRAEVRMEPYHLEPSMGMFAERFLGEMIWVYSNPIYVGVDR